MFTNSTWRSSHPRHLTLQNLWRTNTQRYTSVTALFAFITVGNHDQCTNTQLYADLPNSYTFQPLAFGTLGPLSSSTVVFLTELGRRLSASTGEPCQTAFLLQRLSLFKCPTLFWSKKPLIYPTANRTFSLFQLFKSGFNFVFSPGIFTPKGIIKKFKLIIIRRRHQGNSLPVPAAVKALQRGNAVSFHSTFTTE